MYRPKLFKPSIQSIDAIPLTSLSRDYNDLLAAVGPANILGSYDYSSLIEDFCKMFALKKNADWFWGQATARIASTALPLGSDGLYSAKKWYLETIKNDSVLHALCILAKYHKRSVMIEGQTDQRFRNYCGLVPIFLAAHKKINNIPYKMWNRDEIRGVVEPNLCEAMLVPEVPDLGYTELLEIRDIGLTAKTGAKAGIVKNPVTTYGITAPYSSPLYGVPPLARMMLCQTWCAHPSNRTNLMILDPRDWDNMPAPLVETNLFTSTTENDDSWAL